MLTMFATKLINTRFAPDKKLLVIAGYYMIDLLEAFSDILYKSDNHIWWNNDQ